VRVIPAKTPSLAHPAKSLIWQGTRALPPSEGREKKRTVYDINKSIKAKDKR